MVFRIECQQARLLKHHDHMLQWIIQSMDLQSRAIREQKLSLRILPNNDTGVQFISILFFCMRSGSGARIFR
jgi:hypothetical protein